MALVKGVQTNLEYLENDDESHKILMVDMCAPTFSTVALRKAMKEYAWRDGDFLLGSYPKNGTHLFWETMQMLLNDSAEYLKYSKVLLMMDLRDVTAADALFPSPRVLNSHYRLDVLPKQFRGRKTVLAIRNPKDAVVSFYYFAKQLHDAGLGRLQFNAPFINLDEYIDRFLRDQPEDQVEYGSYFTYYEYMWNLAKDDDNFLIVMFEDCLKKPRETVLRIDKFMGTNRDEKMIDEIVQATTFDKMRKVKEHALLRQATQSNSSNAENRDKPEVTPQSKLQNISVEIFRKGKVGDWKQHLTVSMNERIDKFLSEWPLASEIPFIYE